MSGVVDDALAGFGRLPLPIITHCPNCARQHVDRDEWVTRKHRTHRCEHCTHEWRPANVPTVGVAELPQDDP